MYSIPSDVSLFIVPHPVSMKKSFEGLSREIEECFPEEDSSRSLFIFLNRRRTHMKVLIWDGDGFIIWYKRLEKGCFSWDWSEGFSLDRKHFFLLLEGVIAKRLAPRFSL